MKFSYLFTAFFLILPGVLSQYAHGNANDETIQVSGIVFEDSNNNLVLDDGENGIPGILVSNQTDIVLTDKKGKYSLKIDKDDALVYVIKPAEYTVPLNEYNNPQFYYIHKPEGSSGLPYGGILPIGRLPEKINFPLQKASVRDTFQVVVMADPQTRTLEEVHYLRDDIAAELIGTEALFGITLGDIMFDDLSLFEAYNATMAMTGIPQYAVPGNHDFDKNPETGLRSPETFTQHYGPDYYAFEYGKASFVVLNSVYYGEEQTPGKNRSYVGKIGKNQLEWLENYLQYVPSDQLIVFCMHIPFHALHSSSPSVYVQNRETVFKLVEDRRYLLALSGHLHALENFYLNAAMDWTGAVSFQQISCVAASGNWWSGPKDERGIPLALQLKDGTPNGYHIVSFNGNTYRQSYKAANRDDQYQIRISSPAGVIHREALDSMDIVVNFFNGNRLSEVTCKIDTLDPCLLQLTPMKDPFAVQLHRENPQLYVSWTSVDLSHHIYTAKMTSGLSVGMHRIIVKAKDEFGNTFRQAAIFEIR